MYSDKVSIVSEDIRQSLQLKAFLNSQFSTIQVDDFSNADELLLQARSIKTPINAPSIVFISDSIEGLNAQGLIERLGSLDNAKAFTSTKFVIIDNSGAARDVFTNEPVISSACSSSEVFELVSSLMPNKQADSFLDIDEPSSNEKRSSQRSGVEQDFQKWINKNPDKLEGLLTRIIASKPEIVSSQINALRLQLSTALAKNDKALTTSHNAFDQITNLKKQALKEFNTQKDTISKLKRSYSFLRIIITGQALATILLAGIVVYQFLN